MPYSIKRFCMIVMTPEIETIINTIDNILHSYGLHATVTSGCDGVHSSEASLHYRNRAVDFRITDWGVHTTDIITRGRLILGDKFDVVPEPNHLHVEYDPKERR